MAAMHMASTGLARVSASPGAPAPRPMAFFLRCWEYARDGRDVEASDVQDWGEEFGLLAKVVETAPCGDGCWCEEYYGEFPVDCYRPVEGAPTPAAPVWCLAHRHTIPCPECGPTPAMIEPTDAMIAAAFRVLWGKDPDYQSAGNVEGRVMWARDEERWEELADVLRAALTAQTEQPQ